MGFLKIMHYVVSQMEKVDWKSLAHNYSRCGIYVESSTSNLLARPSLLRVAVEDIVHMAPSIVEEEGHEVFLTLGVVIIDETCVDVLDYVCGRVSSLFVRRFVFILLHGGGSIDV